MKLIPLTQGQFAMVDDSDFNELNKYKWYARKFGTLYYAGRKKSANNLSTSMHRQIMGDIKGTAYDHIDGNGLNNQRSNLRIATKQQNAWNREKRFGVSKYKGVYKKSGSSKWCSQLCGNERRYFLGDFDTQEDAARAYDAKAKELFGEFARFNFPE